MEKFYGVFEISWPAGKKRADELAKQKVWAALRDDGIDKLGFTTFKIFTDKDEAQRQASKIREWKKPKNSTSRLTQLGLWHDAVIVHECTVEGRFGYWKLSKKDHDEAVKHELYQQIKQEKETK